MSNSAYHKAHRALLSEHNCSTCKYQFKAELDYWTIEYGAVAECCRRKLDDITTITISLAKSEQYFSRGYSNYQYLFLCIYFRVLSFILFEKGFKAG
jgi:hypothetical protein